MAVEQVEASTGGGRRGPGGRRLAAQLTSFVGRERDLAEVRGLLQRTRLATLVGSPGVGKTRLAQEVATGLASPSIDVAVVELAALADPSLVPRRVAAAFGVPEEPNRPALDSLGEHLADRRALLVLDNCEHLVEACAGLAETLLRGCGELRVLATSREPLRVPGETIWRVPSLAVPDLDLDPRRDGLEAIVRSPAVALFVDRARAVLPDFSLTPATAPAVAQIARRLDGIPLAIELAAARVDMLSPQQIAERLDQRFDLLTEGSRTALPRHRTLRSLVDWSHDLLSDGERAVLRRLSVFAGGWTIEAAEEVCAGDGVERAAVLGLLGRLVSKSLVVATQTTGEGEEAPASVRYSMLEAFRQYGAERLAEAGEDASVRRRHRDWFLDLAERIQWDLRGPDQGRLFNLLEVEHDNIRGALEWCRRCALAGDVDAIERGFRFGAALNRFWRVRCYWREGRRWLGELFELATEPTEMQARALFVAGDLARQQGEIAEARDLHRRAVSTARQVGAMWPEAFSLMQLGMIELAIEGEQRASDHLLEALPLMVQMGETNGQYHVLRWLAEVAFSRGDEAEARSLADQSLRLAQQLGDHYQIAVVLRLLGEFALSRGDLAEARRHFDRSLEIRRALGSSSDVADTLVLLGRLELDAGNVAVATDLFRQSLEIAWNIGRPPGTVAALDGLAASLAARGEPEKALEWAAAATAYREARATRTLRANEAARAEWLAPIRETLGAPKADAAWDRGRAMPIQDVVADALATAGPVSGGSDADVLSVRERQIAALITEGRTNRQIAERLVISKRTVDAHVQRIMRRLDCHTRAEIAAWAERHHLSA